MFCLGYGVGSGRGSTRSKDDATKVLPFRSVDLWIIGWFVWCQGCIGMKSGSSSLGTYPTPRLPSNTYRKRSPQGVDLFSCGSGTLLPSTRSLFQQLSVTPGVYITRVVLFGPGLSQRVLRTECRGEPGVTSPPPPPRLPPPPRRPPPPKLSRNRNTIQNEEKTQGTIV